MALLKHEVKSPVTASIWMHSTGVGQTTYAGSTILILEAMKLEIPIDSPVDGEVVWLADQGVIVEEGSVVAVIEVS